MKGRAVEAQPNSQQDQTVSKLTWGMQGDQAADGGCWSGGCRLGIALITKGSDYEEPPNSDRSDVWFSRMIKQLMEDAGLVVREDAVGNTYGLWQGSDPPAG